MEIKAGKLYRYICDDGQDIYYFVTRVNGYFMSYYDLRLPDYLEDDMTIWAEDCWEEV